MALTRAQRRASLKKSVSFQEDIQKEITPETTSEYTTANELNSNEVSSNEHSDTEAKVEQHINQKEQSEELSSGSEASLNGNEKESSEEEDSDRDSSEDEDDDEDLDALLNKAQKALSKQHIGEQDQIKLDTEEDENDKSQYKLPKLDSRIAMDKELYIQRTGGKVARLVDGTVDMIGQDDSKKNRKHKKVVEAVKEREKDDKERLSRKQRQEEREKTTGKGWFDMARPEVTAELKRDLQLLKMRHVIDRKRHYKKVGKETPTYFQVGTVVEGPTEYHSARLTRKERKETIVDELMANEDAKQYYKRKYNEGQTRGTNGRKKAKRQMKRL